MSILTQLFVASFKNVSVAPTIVVIPATISSATNNIFNIINSTAISSTISSATNNIFNVINSTAVPATITGAIDPYYSNVSLLLHMDGTNGSTTFTDNSQTPNTLTVNGNTSVNTSIVKYGTGSAYFDGSGDYLSAPGGSQFAFGTENFTIECWVYNLGTGSDKTLIRHGLTSGTTTGSWELNMQSNNLLGFYWNYYTSGNWLIDIGYSPIALSVWTHIAVVRNSNNLQLYVNGVSVASGTISFDLNYTAGNLYIGGANGTYFNGYMDDVRITKGVARYTANFTPPTTAFPNN